MREILFRGKELDTSEWVEGGLIQTESWTSILVCIDTEASSCEPASGELREYEVDPKTVGQFTGLYDKDGEKIFEGDIINSYTLLGMNDLRNAVVEWNELFSGWYSGNHSLYNGLGNVYEIIGNIHDNPELLKENEDG